MEKYGCTLKKFLGRERKGWGMGELSKRAASQLDLHGNRILNFPLRNFMSEMWKYIVWAYKAVMLVCMYVNVLARMLIPGYGHCSVEVAVKAMCLMMCCPQQSFHPFPAHPAELPFSPFPLLTAGLAELPWLLKAPCQQPEIYSLYNLLPCPWLSRALS